MSNEEFGMQRLECLRSERMAFWGLGLVFFMEHSCNWREYAHLTPQKLSGLYSNEWRRTIEENIYIIYVKKLTGPLLEIEIRKNNGDLAFTRG